MLHFLDTVKTRMQGSLTTRSLKYHGVSSSVSTILREEGLIGLYGGFNAAMLGSFGSTLLYFGAYESCKRHLIDTGISPTASYFISGGLADVVASTLYVPSEVEILFILGHQNEITTARNLQ